MTQRSITYLKGISETGDIANQTLFEDLIDSMHPQLPALGTFNPTMTFNVKGQYSDYTPTSSTTVTFTASSIVDGLTQWVKIITDGTVTFAAGSGCELLSGSLGLLQAGTYKFGFGSIFGVVQIIVPGTEQSTQLSTPVITASSQNAAIRIVFSSEDLASTGRELLRSTVNDVQTASSVAGFDGTADYVDDNNGAGLTNGTTYYYWGRNTAPGFTNSAYATDSAAPSAGVTQLTQPTGLTATGGNNTAALAYEPIDANADDVAVQRSLTSGSGFATIATISRALTSYDDNTAVNGTTYYYRLIANGSGSYSNSDPSAEDSATPGGTILLNDSFDTLWTLTNPDPTHIVFTVASGLVTMDLDNAGVITFFNNYLKANSNFNKQTLVVRFDVTGSNNSNSTYGVLISNSASDRMLLVNDANAIDLTSRIVRTIGGSSNTTDFAENINGSWKIKIDGTTVYVYRHNGVSWVNLANIASAYGQINWDVSINGGTSNNAAVTSTVSNFFVTDYDYTTLTP